MAHYFLQTSVVIEQAEGDTLYLLREHARNPDLHIFTLQTEDLPGGSYESNMRRMVDLIPAAVDPSSK